MAFLSSNFTHTQVDNNAFEITPFAIGDFSGYDSTKNIIFRSITANAAVSGSAEFSISPSTTGGTICFYSTFSDFSALNLWNNPVVAPGTANYVLFSTSFPTGTVIIFKIDYQIVDKTNPFLNYYGSSYATIPVTTGFDITQILGVATTPLLPKNILFNAGASTRVNFYIGQSPSNCILVSSTVPTAIGVDNIVTLPGLIATGQKLFIGIDSPNPTEPVNLVINSSVLN